MKIFKNQVEIKPHKTIGIHVTFLSVIIGLFSAYYIWANSEIHKAQYQAISEAGKINKINFVRSAYIPQDETIFMANGHQDIDQLKKLIIYLIFLTSQQPGDTSIEENQIPKDPAKRAEKILILMNVISHRYPFPKAIEGTSQFPQEPIIFENADSLREWLNDMDTILSVLKSITLFLPLMPTDHLNTYFNSLMLREKDNIQRMENDKFFQVMGERNPFYLVSDFIRGMHQAYDIYNSTNNALKKSDYLQNWITPRYAAFGIWLGGFLVLITGVFLPLVLKEMNKILYLYIPIGYYFVIFILIGVKVICI